MNLNGFGSYVFQPQRNDKRALLQISLLSFTLNENTKNGFLLLSFFTFPASFLKISKEKWSPALMA
jgi:hypothetical protein